MTVAKYVIQTDNGAPPLAAYSQGWRAGDFIFVTGTGPIGPDGKVKGGTIEEQTEHAIDNLEAILRADGAALENVVKATVHLSDAKLFVRYNEVYRRRFRAPYPARMTAGSDLSMVPGLMILIDVIAYVGK